MGRFSDEGSVWRRFALAAWLLVWGAVLTPLTAAQAQDVRQQGPGYGLNRRAANKAASAAGRSDWPTLGDDGTPGTQVHISFNARNADVTLVTPADYAQSKLLKDAQTIAPRLGFPRADYLVYDNTKTCVVDMEFNKYLRPLPSGNRGATFDLPLTRLATLLSASSLPRPIVLYVEGDAADEASIIGASGKTEAVGAAYFVGSDEAVARAKGAEETLRFRAQIAPLSYLAALGFGGMILFMLVTMARLPWMAAQTKRKAAQKKAEPVLDPAEVQRRYNAQKPQWVTLITTFAPAALIPVLVIGLRGHGLAHVLSNAFLLMPSALTSGSPVVLPAYMMGGTMGVFGLSWVVCALVERRNKKATLATGGETAPSEREAENPMQGFMAPLFVMFATVPLMFLITFLPRSVRMALGPVGGKSLIYGIMFSGFFAAFVVGLNQWRKARTTLLPGNPWHDMVKEVAHLAGDVPVRHVVLTRSPSANASASVFNTVNITSGLLEKMEPDEVRVVIAHEIAHLKGGHAKKTIVVGLVVLAAYLLVLWLVVFPLKSRIDPVAYALLSSPLPGILLGNLLTPLLVGRGRRKREHEADRMAAQITGDTELVIHTLRKLHTLSASPHHLKPSDELLSSHPSLAHRIDALRQTG